MCAPSQKGCTFLGPFTHFTCSGQINCPGAKVPLECGTLYAAGAAARFRSPVVGSPIWAGIFLLPHQKSGAPAPRSGTTSARTKKPIT